MAHKVNCSRTSSSLVEWQTDEWYYIANWAEFA